MRVPSCVERLVPPDRRALPRWARLLAVVVVAAVVVAGVWVTGGLLTNDFALAQVLTGVFLAGVGAAAALVGLRWRALAWPVVASYALTAGVLGGFLLVTSHRDVTVNETVVMVDEGAETMSSAERPRGSGRLASAPVVVASGSFESAEHETSGTARVVRLADRSHVLTLTDLDTDPGPDLRVYLVPGDGSSVSGHLDLGALKGNRGNQQYRVPDAGDVADFGAVVIWCRAFSVAFGSAALT